MQFKREWIQFQNIAFQIESNNLNSVFLVAQISQLVVGSEVDR